MWRNISIQGASERGLSGSRCERSVEAAIHGDPAEQNGEGSLDEVETLIFIFKPFTQHLLI